MKAVALATLARRVHMIDNRDMSEKKFDDIPTTMMSVVTQTDYPDAKELGAGLALAEVPVPKPNEGEVLIRVSYAGINRADTLQAAGHYPPPPGASNVLGLECSGTVVAIGGMNFNDAKMPEVELDDDGVPIVDEKDIPEYPEPRGDGTQTTPIGIGTEVCALVKGGGYGPYVVADARSVFPLPPGLDLQGAAAILESAVTSYYCLVERCRLRGGDTVLIHGGSGSVGAITVQMAQAMQLKLFTTAGSSQRCSRLEELVKCQAIDYHNDVVGAIKEATDNQGVTAVIDVLGAGGLRDNMAMLTYGGRLMILGLQKGVKTDINLMTPMNKALEIHSGTMRNMSLEMGQGLRTKVIRDVFPMIREKDVSPIIDEVVDIESLPQAFTRITGKDSDTRPFGKIILRVDA